MNKNVFFEQKGPFLLSEIFDTIDLKKKTKIVDIRSLEEAGNFDITFLDSPNYTGLAKLTKAACCITTDKLKGSLPSGCVPIIVKNVLFELCKVTRKFYPYADIDTPDLSLKRPAKSKYSKVRFGNNVFIGKNVKIGENTIIGSNTILY